MMKKILEEFKEFALKGSMFDMAIGVIMGGAVSKVVTSIVTDIVTPLISIVTGGEQQFVDLVWTLNGVTLNVGLFINNLIDFFVTAVIIFCLVKALNTFRKKKEEPVPAVPEISSTDQLLMEILEELKKQK